MEKKFVYQCVFHAATGCGGGIEESAVDPCSLVLTGDWLHDASHAEQDDNWQQFWCHLECFVKVTGRSALDVGLRDELLP